MKRSSLRCSSTPFVHRYTKRLRFTSSATIRPMSGCSSGSPPAIETIGAPDSSIAATASSTLTRLRRISVGYWILPHPAHSRLHANNGSSSTMSGKCSRREIFWRAR